MLHVEHLLIFLASPGDVPRERKYVYEAVDEVNRTVANPRGIVLTVRSWEKNTFSEYGGDPQSLVNVQIADMKQYALFVGIMWSRLGTPTKNAASGTVEEFDRAVTARRRTKHSRPSIMFFFRDAPFNPTRQDELDQKGKVIAFKARVQRGGLTATYKTPSQFRDEFRNQLILWLNKRAPVKTRASRSAPRGGDSPPRDARDITTPKPPVRQPAAVPPAAKKTSASTAPREAGTSLNGRTSVLLGDKLYRSESVNTRADLSVILRLLPQNPSEKAALNALRPYPYQQREQVSFAYQDDGFACRVESVESESQGGRTVYIVTLTPEDQRHGGFSAIGSVNGISGDQLATLRARLLLLNERPTGPQFTGTLSMSHWVTNADGPVKIERGLFPDLWPKFQSQPMTFRIYAHLMALYCLRASRTVEHVLELKLGPIRNGSMTVRFRGEWKSSQYGQPSVIVEVSGTCALAKP